MGTSKLLYHFPVLPLVITPAEQSGPQPDSSACQDRHGRALPVLVTRDRPVEPPKGGTRQLDVPPRQGREGAGRVRFEKRVQGWGTGME